MYKKNEKETIAKKRYSFKKGYLQVTLAQKKEVRKRLMSVLCITRMTYFSSILNSGIIDISMSKYEGITAVLSDFGISDIWDITNID